MTLIDITNGGPGTAAVAGIIVNMIADAMDVPRTSVQEFTAEVFNRDPLNVYGKIALTSSNPEQKLEDAKPKLDHLMETYPELKITNVKLGLDPGFMHLEWAWNASRLAEAKRVEKYEQDLRAKKFDPYPVFKEIWKRRGHGG